MAEQTSKQDAQGQVWYRVGCTGCDVKVWRLAAKWTQCDDCAADASPLARVLYDASHSVLK